MSAQARAAKAAAWYDRASRYAVARPGLARIWRTAARYVEVRINRLAGFVTYYGFMGLFPLATLAFAVVGVLARYVPQLDDAVDSTMQDQVAVFGLSPAFVDQFKNAAVSLGLISLGFLIYAGVRWIEALREAIAIVNGGDPPRGNLTRRIAADLVLLLLLGLVLLAWVVLSVITTTSASWLAESVGWSSFDAPVRIAALAVSLLSGALILGLVIQRLAGRPVSRVALVKGAIVGAVGLEGLRLGATLIIENSLSNPVYGIFAVTIGLLIWINLTVKWVLITAAWVAVYEDGGLGTYSFLPSPSGSGDQPLSATGVAAASPDAPPSEDGSGSE